MATLQREPVSETTTTNTVTQSTPTGPVPTPFPPREGNASHSRSPSATRTRISGILDKVKRAISSSRERGSGDRERSADRRRESDAGDIREEDEARGRTGASGVPFETLKATETGTTVGGLSKTASRSASRGRVAMSGRGGAGNILVGDVPEDAGEEPEDAVRQARADRSRSRGRAEEMFVAGRGGRGNMRSESVEEGRELPSVDDRLRVQQEEERIEHQAMASHQAKLAATNHVFASGRGGAGNMRYTSPPRDASSSV